MHHTNEYIVLCNTLNTAFKYILQLQATFCMKIANCNPILIAFHSIVLKASQLSSLMLFSCHGCISNTWCMLIMKLAVTRVPLVNPFKNGLFTIFFCKYKILIMSLTGTVRDTVLYIYHWERAGCRAVWLWRNPDAFAMLSSRCHIIMYRKAIRKHIGWMASALILASTFVSGFDASLFFSLCNIKIVAVINSSFKLPSVPLSCCWEVEKSSFSPFYLKIKQRIVHVTNPSVIWTRI